MQKSWELKSYKILLRAIWANCVSEYLAHVGIYTPLSMMWFIALSSLLMSVVMILDYRNQPFDIAC